MKRRDLLAVAGCLGVLSTGCLSDDPAAPGTGDPEPSPTAPGETESPTGTDGTEPAQGPDTETDSPNGTQSPDESTDTPAEPAITDRSFTVTDQDCGTGENAAAVTYADETVTVDGTISGSNACYTAELDHATYDSDTDELTVSVRSYNPTPDRVCADCIVDIEYESRISFEGGLPDETVVVHNGERLATVGRGE